MSSLHMIRQFLLNVKLTSTRFHLARNNPAVQKLNQTFPTFAAVAPSTGSRDRDIISPVLSWLV